MFKHRSSASLGALAVAIATPAMAEEPPADDRTGVIVVTATKRSENLQDVSVAVNAIGEKALDELRVDTFEDYLEQLPNVTAGGGGPGQSTIYIRGLASTTPNLTIAGVAGLAPNVALYLDEQPLAQPGRNLDVYAADLERIEVLAGPQGTLFGASSQAGTVRLITNKPSLSGFAASAKGGVSFTRGGEESYKGELMLNIPVTQNLAVRGVVYLDDQGGYIDNVAGTRTAAESGRFRRAGTVRANGVPVSGNRAGFQAGKDFTGINLIPATNTDLVENNFNDTQYSGFRVSALYEFAPDWRLTVSHSRQSIESDGVFFADPDLGLGSLDIQRFSDDRLEDDFSNTSWTLEGRLGALELLYTGAYTDRGAQQRVDYTDYMFVGQYLPYYICDTAVAYPAYVAAAPANPTCQAPNLSVNAQSDTSVFTQEFRVNTPQEKRIRATVGGFYSDLTLKERNDFVYPGSRFVRGSDGVTTGFLPNFPLTNTSVTGAVGNGASGFFSEPGPFPAGVIFRNDVKRTDMQWGLFGEASFDVVPDKLSVTVGARYYDIEVDFEGSANSSFYNLNSAIFGSNAGLAPGLGVDAQGGGTNISAQFAPNNTVGAPDTAKTSGVIFKGTVTFTPTDDLLFFATYSEGFRPGLLNRPGGAAGPGGFVVPFELETDDVQNFEFGWKTRLFDRQLRFNGSAFYVDITRLQTTIFDTSIVNLFFSDNAADARIYGVEGDFTFAPNSMPGLTVAGAFSFLDTKITKVLTPTNDVLRGSELAFAPSFQGNLRARYEWDLNDTLRAHVQPQVVHSASKFTDIIEINKLKLDSYTTVALSLGVRTDEWGFEVFADNLFDERAQLSGNFFFDRARIVTNRPRTIGFRVSFKN
jgi:outer membrane receptor protein involved in Fe transport